MIIEKLTTCVISLFRSHHNQATIEWSGPVPAHPIIRNSATPPIDAGHEATGVTGFAVKGFFGPKSCHVQPRF